MRIAFAGTPEFSKGILAALIGAKHNIVAVYTQPDRPKGRGKKLLPSPVKELALQYDIPVLQPTNLKNPEAKPQLQQLNIDLMIVVAYGLILPQNILNIAKDGCINIHASLLPRWRGAAPIQRAIIAGDQATGITIMKMDAGLDTGDMLLTKQCSISDNESSASLECKLKDISIELILKFLESPEFYLNGATTQDNNKASYAKKITKCEAKINWNDAAINIARKIRAFNPAPGCYCVLSDQVTRVKIWQTIVIVQDANVAPGTIIQANNNGIDIATGDNNILRLLQLQMPGGKALRTKEILNSKAQLFAIGLILQ